MNQDALKEDKSMLDVTALSYAQQKHNEVAAQLGDSSFTVFQHEFEGLQSLFAELITGLELIDDKRTIREQLTDLGLDPEEHEEPSDQDIDDALLSIEIDILSDRLMNLQGRPTMHLAQPVAVPGPEEKKLDSFGEKYKAYKQEVKDLISDEKEKEDYGVKFSAGCFSLMFSGDVFRNAAVFSTLSAFSNSSFYSFGFLNASQQVANPGSKPFCLVTY